MKKCKNCHRYLEDYLEVCPNCGRPADRFVEESTPVSSFSQEKEIEKKKPVRKNTKRKPKRIIGMIIALILCVLLPILILFFLFIFTDDFFVDEKPTMEVVSTSPVKEDVFMKLYDTYNKNVLEDAPIELINEIDPIEDYLEKNGWKKQEEDTFDAFYQENCIIYIYTIDDTYTNLTIFVGDECAQEDYDILIPVVSSYVIENLQIPYDQGSFGVTKEIQEEIQKFSKQEYSNGTSYSYSGDEFYAILDKMEDADEFYIGQEEGITYLIGFDTAQNRANSFSIIYKN